MMKRSGIFALVVIFVISGLIAISIMRAEEVPVINVKAEVSVAADSRPVVNIVNLEQDEVNPLKSPSGSSTTSFPSVDALAIINYARVSYWASNPYTGGGTHDFVIGFPKGAVPEQGDVIKVIVSVADESGDTLASDTRIMNWE